MAENSHPFVEALALATDLYTDEELSRWLQSGQPLFDGLTPIELLAAGRSDELRAALYSLNDGNFV